MPRNLPLPTVLSLWGEKWNKAWQLLGILDGRNHAVRRANGFIVNDANKTGAWRLLWEYMFYQVLNTRNEIDGFSVAFAQDCYILWERGYRRHSDEIDFDGGAMSRDVDIHEKGDLIHDLWMEFLADEPPEFDRYWL